MEKTPLIIGLDELVMSLPLTGNNIYSNNNNNKLTEFNCTNNIISAQTSTALGRSFMIIHGGFFSGLTHLNLSSNNICNDVDCETLFSTFVGLKSLLALNLSCNALGDKGILHGKNKIQ